MELKVEVKAVHAPFGDASTIPSWSGRLRKHTEIFESGGFCMVEFSAYKKKASGQQPPRKVGQCKKEEKRAPRMFPNNARTDTCV